MGTHPYIGGDARSRARRIVSHLRALFKGVGRSPRPRQARCNWFKCILPSAEVHYWLASPLSLSFSLSLSFAAHFPHHSAVRMHRAKPCARLIREHCRHYLPPPLRPETGRNEILVERTVVICGVLSFVINREAWKSVPQSTLSTPPPAFNPSMDLAKR